MECPNQVKPQCKDGYELVQKVGGCCQVYECVCDVTLCKNDIPQCSENHVPVSVNNGGCCPEYQCICDPESCPKTYCGVDEVKILTNSDSCCSFYR